jgi:FKBP-type peptidyl-prolyl cis-trans isomerase
VLGGLLLLSAVSSWACKSGSEREGGESVRRAASSATLGAASAVSAEPSAKRRNPDELTFPGPEAPPEAQALPNGVKYRVLRRGTPAKDLEAVVADVAIWSKQGELAFSSYGTRQAEFSLSILPEDLAHQIASLGIGGDAIFWLPSAAVDGWRLSVLPAGDVVARIEVLRRRAPAKTTAQPLGRPASKGAAVKPPAVGGPPSDATTTPNGLRFVVLRRGEGPTPSQRDAEVTTRVSGYVAAGLEVQQVLSPLETTTTLRRAPGGLGQVLEHMRKGGVNRIWVPPDKAGSLLADRAGQELVLDVELLEIE